MIYNKEQLNQIVKTQNVEVQGIMTEKDKNIIHLARYPKYKSSSDGVHSICGHGSFHMYYTGDISKVTCKKCLSKNGYTVKYINIKTDKTTYIDLKPMTLQQAYTFKSKHNDYEGRLIEVICYIEYMEYKEELNYIIR